MLVGRIEEKKSLENFFKSNQAEFLAIYGRRRIGKTYLVKQFFDSKNCIFFHSTGLKNGKLSEQINLFVKSIADAFFKGADVNPKNKKNWIDAFEYLTDTLNRQAAKNQKVVLFMDELPWMATKKSKLLQALDYFWNHYWSHDNRIKLIICGSSASWIINKVINNKGGLHNRITKKILLRPFDLSETKKYLVTRGVKLNNWQVSQIYMITGGVPFYLSFIEKGQSSVQVIEQLAFTSNGPLLKEFDNLFSSLFEHSELYIELIRIIAKNRYGIAYADISKESKKLTSGGAISAKLNALEEAGFIIKFMPYQHKKKGIYYKVIDEYTLFYLYWIEPIRGNIQKNIIEQGYWQAIHSKASWNIWAGLAFESMVYKQLSQLRKKLKIPVTAMADTWRYIPSRGSDEQGAQIDLLFDRMDNVVTICEIKYTDKPFVIDKEYSKKLINKRDFFIKQTGTKKDIFIAIISAHGIVDNPYSDALVTGVVTLDDFFAD